MPSEDEIDSVEALAWLEQADGKDRTVGEDGGTCLSTKDALRLVRELYAAGATEVLARISTVEYEFEEAAGLTVVLPQDWGQRAALFSVGARVMREMGSGRELAADQGQAAFALGW